MRLSEEIESFLQNCKKIKIDGDNIIINNSEKINISDITPNTIKGIIKKYEIPYDP